MSEQASLFADEENDETTLNPQESELDEDLELVVFHEMLAFLFENYAGFAAKSARSRASYFTSIEEFLNLDLDKELVFQGVIRKLPKLKEKRIIGLKIIQTSGILDKNKTVLQNYLFALGSDFIIRQKKNIKGLSLEQLSPNPFLIRSLNLVSPQDVLYLNVYLWAGRSIVTSMGYFVEKLLLASSVRPQTFRTHT